MKSLYMGVAKVKVTASIKGDLVDWIDKEVDKSRFASRTHAVEYALTKLKEADNLALPN
jgi:Arc/MetJ-type ribon-helix-helix transcriptional regulator